MKIDETCAFDHLTTSSTTFFYNFLMSLIKLATLLIKDTSEEYVSYYLHLAPAL
jgi:hypothetical protein